MSGEQTLWEIRQEKLEGLRRLGLDPYAQEKHESHYSAKDLVSRYEKLAPAPEATPEEARARAFSFAARIVNIRIMGKAAFADLSDGDGRIQAYFRKNDLTEQLWEAFQLLDIGDHIGLVGHLFETKTKEKSIYVHGFTPLSKCLRALPLGKEKDGERWYSLEDVELRYRHRHLDLLANPEARRLLLGRAKVASAVRRYFLGEDFLEVETPILQIEAGGAAARPFLTRYNAYGMDVKLRISLELYLKRILCGDVPRVFEIGRVFRNEGVSNRHNPEFSLLEWYEAYVNLEDTQKRVEEVFSFVAKDVFGSTEVMCGETLIDFGRPWARVDLLTEITSASGLSEEELRDYESAKAGMRRIGLDPSNERNLGGIIEKLLEVFVEPKLIQPTFVVGYPLETSPLAKKDPSRPGFTRRCEGYVMGKEVCNMFSEINDPIDQRERFEQQLRESAKGDEEAHPMDEDFLYALECGMPPAGGCGIGIDRMAMMLTGASNIREILMFPMMKPEDPTPATP
jgi:lysyl-tRNA synthetase, class II